MKALTHFIVFIFATAISVYFFSRADHMTLQGSLLLGLACGIGVAIVSIAADVFVRQHKAGNGLFTPTEEVWERVGNQIKTKMLHRMQYQQGVEDIRDFIKTYNYYMSRYPKIGLKDWPPFKAWYKDLVDRALARPDMYTLTNSDGTPYNKDADSFYDPDAPDWSLYDVWHGPYSDDEDEFDTDDDDDEFIEDPTKKSFAESAREGFWLGVGFNIGNQWLDGGDSGQSCS